MTATERVFSTERLTFARERRECTQARLADLLNVSTRTIKSYEQGDTHPGDLVVDRMSVALDFPASFFFQPPLMRVESAAASFRSFTKVSEKLKARATAAGTIGIEYNQFLENRLHLPRPNIPDDLRRLDPVGAADSLRHIWGIGQQPIPHVIRLLEKHGVRVYALSEDCTAIDAFSLWRDGTPFIFLNTRKTAERSLFDAAHELGHLVLHGHGSPVGQEAEAQADLFASHFLMPHSGFLALSSRMKTVAGVLSTKKKWRTSAAAIVRRMRDLDLLTQWDYRRLNIEFSRGGKSNEPQPIQRETSVLIPKALAALEADGYSLRDIASDLCVPAWELRVLSFGFGTIAGAGKSVVSKPANLRLVNL